MHTRHLFAAAFNVCRPHLTCDILALLGGDRGQALRLQEIDAGAFVAEIRLEANKEQGRCWAEMKDFGIPLEYT